MNIKLPKRIKVQVPPTMKNAGEGKLNDLFKKTDHEKPVSVRSSEMKFSGLKRYLKRAT